MQTRHGCPAIFAGPFQPALGSGKAWDHSCQGVEPASFEFVLSRLSSFKPLWTDLSNIQILETNKSLTKKTNGRSRLECATWPTYALINPNSHLMCQRREGKLILNLLAFSWWSHIQMLHPATVGYPPCRPPYWSPPPPGVKDENTTSMLQIQTGIGVHHNAKRGSWVGPIQPNVMSQCARGLNVNMLNGWHLNPKGLRKPDAGAPSHAGNKPPWPQRTREGFGTWRHVGTQKSCETSHSPH